MVTGTAMDNAGNRSTLVVGPINLDRTPPTIAMSTPTSTYSVDQVVSVSCSASDAVSGLDPRLTTCANLSQPTYALGLGVHTVSGTAVDLAGNFAGASVTFAVVDTFDGLCRLTRQFETCTKWPTSSARTSPAPRQPSLWATSSQSSSTLNSTTRSARTRLERP